MPLRLVCLAALCGATLSACATVTRGANDVLEINTTPAGAQVQTSNGLSCGSTPCGLKMKRRSELTVKITREGCIPVEVAVSNRTAGAGGAALAGNVLVGGVIGLGVDAATGASQELVPNPIEVTLECEAA